MHNKDFPIVDPSNLWISCFNCFSDSYDFYYQKTENAPNKGKYYSSCECCGMKTFFDFLEKGTQ